MGTYIQYNAFPGLVTRVMDKATWKRLEIDFDQDVTFESSNRNTVDASDFPEEVLDVFREDGDFKIVESDTRPKAPKQVTGEDYERVMAKANEKALALDGDSGDGAGSGASTGSAPTPRTSATSTASTGKTSKAR